MAQQVLQQTVVKERCINLCCFNFRSVGFQDDKFQVSQHIDRRRTIGTLLAEDQVVLQVTEGEEQVGFLQLNNDAWEQQSYGQQVAWDAAEQKVHIFYIIHATVCASD